MARSLSKHLEKKQEENNGRTERIVRKNIEIFPVVFSLCIFVFKFIFLPSERLAKKSSLAPLGEHI